jgi:hypothetical protein
MMTVTQTTRLLGWVIAGLILLGILLFFWPGSAENRRENRHRFNDRRANLVSTLAPPW